MRSRRFTGVWLACSRYSSRRHGPWNYRQPARRAIGNPRNAPLSTGSLSQANFVAGRQNVRPLRRPVGLALRLPQSNSPSVTNGAQKLHDFDPETTVGRQDGGVECRRMAGSNIKPKIGPDVRGKIWQTLNTLHPRMPEKRRSTNRCRTERSVAGSARTTASLPTDTAVSAGSDGIEPENSIRGRMAA